MGREPEVPMSNESSGARGLGGLGCTSQGVGNTKAEVGSLALWNAEGKDRDGVHGKCPIGHQCHPSGEP